MPVYHVSRRGRVFRAKADDNWPGGRRFRVYLAPQAPELNESGPMDILVAEYEGGASDPNGWTADEYPSNPLETYPFDYTEAGARKVTKFLHAEGVNRKVVVKV